MANANIQSTLNSTFKLRYSFHTFKLYKHFLTNIFSFLCNHFSLVINLLNTLNTKTPKHPPQKSIKTSEISEPLPGI